MSEYFLIVVIEGRAVFDPVGVGQELFHGGGLLARRHLGGLVHPRRLVDHGDEGLSQVVDHLLRLQKHGQNPNGWKSGLETFWCLERSRKCHDQEQTLGATPDWLPSRTRPIRDRVRHVTIKQEGVRRVATLCFDSSSKAFSMYLALTAKPRKLLIFATQLRHLDSKTTSKAEM